MRAPLTAFILLAFITTSILSPLPVMASDALYLPKPGVMVHTSPSFKPPVLKGIKVHTDNPFQFDFILDPGDAPLPQQEQLKTESTKLIKYFLASLTTPEQDLWVNLSPYEKQRIIPESFGNSGMGRDLLAQDYLLKQITASLIYPEDDIGKKFWDRVYAQAQEKFGTTEIPVNTFNKVWIVPDKAVVYENAKTKTAYIVESSLKVMLEEDYLALQKSLSSPNAVSTLGSQIIREVVIPELTKEVNEGKNFAPLRQVYQSLLLATWYKTKVKDSILNKIYSDKNKTKNLSSPNALVGDPQHIYQQYLQAFKKGVFNYIKEEPSSTSTTIPRKYFSGGVVFGREASNAMIVVHQMPANPSINNAMVIKAGLDVVDSAMARFDPLANNTLSNGYEPGWQFNPQPGEKVILIAEDDPSLANAVLTLLDGEVRGYTMVIVNTLGKAGQVVDAMSDDKIKDNVWAGFTDGQYAVGATQEAGFIHTPSSGVALAHYVLTEKRNDFGRAIPMVVLSAASEVEQQLRNEKLTVPFFRKPLGVMDAVGSLVKQLKQAEASRAMIALKQEGSLDVEKVISFAQQELGTKYDLNTIKGWIKPYLINGLSDEKALIALLKHLLSQKTAAFRNTIKAGKTEEWDRQEMKYFKLIEPIIAELVEQGEQEIVITTIGPGAEPGQTGELYEVLFGLMRYLWKHGLKRDLTVKIRLYEKDPQSLLALQSARGLKRTIKELGWYKDHPELAEHFHFETEFFYGDVTDIASHDQMLLPSNIIFWRHSWVLQESLMSLAEVSAFVDKLRGKITKGMLMVREFDVESKPPVLIQEIIGLENVKPPQESGPIVSPTGGIDLKADKVNLQVQNSGQDIRFNMDPAQFSATNIDGLTPVIINILPLPNVMEFLGA